MRRPLLLICFSEAFGIVIAYNTGLTLWQLLLLCAAAFVMLSKDSQGKSIFEKNPNSVKTFDSTGNNNQNKQFILSLTIIALLLGFSNTRASEARWKKDICDSGYNFTIQDSDLGIQSYFGIISKVAIKEYYTALTLNTGKEKILIRFDVTGDERVYDLVGREAEVTGKTSLPDEKRNPGSFDYRLYLKGQGIYKICEVSKYRLEAGPVKRHVLHYLSSSKGKFFSSAEKYMDAEEFSVMAGLLFGEKGFIDENLYGEFQQNGVAHVLAVSGLHVGLLYAAILKLLQGRKNIWTSLTVLLSLFIYAALSNFSVSVLRASVMIALNITAFHIKRRYDMISAASLAAMLFMTVNPYQLFDSGFQLSFCAAYSMGVALPWINLKLIELADKQKKNWIYDIGNVLAPCLMVQMGMTPLIMYHFTTFSPVSLLLNPFAVALAGAILPVGLMLFAASLSGLTLPFIGLAGSENALCKLLIRLNQFGSGLNASYDVPAPAPIVLCLYYCCFFFFFSETRYILSRRCLQNARTAVWGTLICSCMLLPWLFGWASSPVPWDYGVGFVTFVDVGQGDCIHIHSSSADILIDGGGKFRSNVAEQTLKPYLLKNGITNIDLALITHMDGDHYRGIEQLAEIYNVKQIAYPGSFKAGDIISIDEAMTLTVLWPSSSTDPNEGKNDSSLVCMLDIDGIKILLTGDLEFEGEKQLIDLIKDLNAYVLKVSHHGSAGATGENFLDLVSPSFAIISCGRNNSYGHPSDRVIELLKNSDIIYGRTDQDGAIVLKKIKRGILVFENASKQKRWLIKTETKNIHSKPLRK